MQHIMMRQAVGAAQDAAGAVARAVAGGIAERRLVGLHRHLDHAACAAAKFSLAAGIRAELVAGEEQRKARLGDLEAAEFDAAGEAPPPGRAWNRCQMKARPLRGSRPWMAMRKRRPQPAMARSGQAGASALITASMISLAQWLVHNVTGAPASAHTTVPGLAITVSGRNAPSFFGVSGSIK